MAVTYADGAITLDNPPANSYDIEFMYQLGAALTDAEADAAAHVIVVRSASPKFFSAGADVDWMRASAGLSYEGNVADANVIESVQSFSTSIWANGPLEG